MKNIDVNVVYQWPLRKQLIIFAIIFAVAFYFGYRWDLSKLAGQLDEAKRQEVDLKQQIQMAITKEIKLQDEITQFKQFEQLLSRWKAKLTTANEVPHLLNDILKIGASSHITFNLFSPGEEIVEGNYKKIGVKIIAVGDYHQLANFISQLANLSKVVAVKDFTITNASVATPTAPAAGMKENNALTTEMMLLIYVIIPETIHETKSQSK